MTRLEFPRRFKHDHPPIQNVNELFAEQMSFGQRAADNVARVVGSWTFLIVQTILLILWIGINIIGFIGKWDPYPFILMNLVLSTQAAFTAPILMMSQNRQAAKDRLEAHLDYAINNKAEEEIRAILDHLHAHSVALSEIHKILDEMRGNKSDESMA